MFDVHVNQASLTITTITHAVRSLHFSICLCAVLSESIQRGSPNHYPAGVLQPSLTVFVLVALAVHMGQTGAAGFVPKSHRSQVWCSCFSQCPELHLAKLTKCTQSFVTAEDLQTEALKTFLNIFILWILDPSICSKSAAVLSVFIMRMYDSLNGNSSWKTFP